MSTISWPPEFDASFYLRQNSDLGELSREDAYAHFQTRGKRQGRLGTPFAARHYFLKLIPLQSEVLEIGPFAAPVFTGENVRYFDVIHGRWVSSGWDSKYCRLWTI